VPAVVNCRCVLL